MLSTTLNIVPGESTFKLNMFTFMCGIFRFSTFSTKRTLALECERTSEEVEEGKNIPNSRGGKNILSCWKLITRRYIGNRHVRLLLLEFYFFSCGLTTMLLLMTMMMSMTIETRKKDFLNTQYDDCMQLCDRVVSFHPRSCSAMSRLWTKFFHVSFCSFTFHSHINRTRDIIFHVTYEDFSVFVVVSFFSHLHLLEFET